MMSVCFVFVLCMFVEGTCDMGNSGKFLYFYLSCVLSASVCIVVWFTCILNGFATPGWNGHGKLML